VTAGGRRSAREVLLEPMARLAGRETAGRALPFGGPRAARFHVERPPGSFNWSRAFRGREGREARGRCSLGRPWAAHGAPVPETGRLSRRRKDHGAPRQRSEPIGPSLKSDECRGRGRGRACYPGRPRQRLQAIGIDRVSCGGRERSEGRERPDHGLVFRLLPVQPRHQAQAGHRARGRPGSQVRGSRRVRFTCEANPARRRANAARRARPR
jgi:hypothetical protein